MADLRSNNGLRRWVPAALLLAGTLGASPAAWARRNGIDTAGCDGCHSGGRPTTVSLTASSLNPPLGQPVTLTITVSNTNGPVAGFYLTTDDVNRGTFRTVESGTLANAFGVLHTTPRAGVGGVSTFKVEWSAPVATGVNFSAYALSANGDASARGDGPGSASLGVVTGCAGATFYMDQDGDGVGTSDTAYPTRRDCTKPLGFAPVTGDCNDFNGKIFPGAVEQCDAKDNNCDGKIDESIVYQMYCEDKDGDGHGVIGGATKSDCAPSVGFGDCKGDCNDASAVVRPGGTEVCDNRDNNCDGRVDEGVRMTCGVGWCRRYAEGCTSICTPGAPLVEQCNSFDDDCDGMIDDGTDAELCGTSGMVCVLGRCIAGDGGSAGSGGGSPSGSGGGGMSGGSGGGAASGGGATGLAGTGSGGPGPGNGGIGAPGGAGGMAGGGAAAAAGGCAVGPDNTSAGLGTCLFFAGLALLLQSGVRGRRVFPGAGLRARTCACQKSPARFSPSRIKQG